MRFDDLTDIERDIARMIASGMTNNQIAHYRGVQPGTVHAQVDSIRAKLGARNRAALAAEFARWKKYGNR